MYKSKQEIVDRIIQYYFVEKKNTGFQEGGVCLYETEDGGRCVVGCLLTEEQIAEIKVEGMNKAPISIILNNGMLHELYPFKTFLSTLQSAHDNCREENFRQLFWDSLVCALDGDPDVTLPEEMPQ